MYRLLLLFLLATTLMNAQSAKPAAPAAGSLPALADRYFNEFYFKYNPTAGTASGYHQYDTRFEDLSQKSIVDQVAALKRFLPIFEQVDAAQLNADERIDRALIVSDIKARLLALENIRNWEKNPDVYSSSLSGSAFTIMARKFASPDARMKSLAARERLMPKMLQDARLNLKNPPKIYTEVAIEQLPGNISFFQKDVPEAFKDAKDPAVRKEFEAANAAVIAALQDYEKWLKSDLLPKSNGDFRLGTDNFRKKLLYDEDVEIPLDRLLEIGMANLRRNQEEFRRVSKLIDPSKSAQQILDELEKDHPAPDHLLQTFRDVLGGLRDFINARHIVTVPSPVLPILEETPPFERALTMASMDTPGPYEKIAKEAYFNVTLPEANWPQKEVEEHMAGFNRGTVISTAIHEAYPGHYVQFLWVQHTTQSRTRKLLGCASNAEGWAHYAEQMMLDEGYGRTQGVSEEKDTAFLKLRLGQLQDALLRNARFIVGIQMHTGKMTFDQGVDFFEKEGFQSHANSVRETKRGTSDPTYLYYTLGKLQFLKLRDDVKKKQGSAFSLEKFHDDLLREGFPPVGMIRHKMLGDNSPAL